jgi:archaemetzincin
MWKLTILCLLTMAMTFKAPMQSERLKAIGNTAGLSDTLKKAFDPGNDFEPIPEPKPEDWLANHYEPGQTFDDFVSSHHSKPNSTHNKIYLQPLGQFPKEPNDLLANLREYASAFFCMDVMVLPPLDLKVRDFTSRINQHTHKRQLLTTDILNFLTQVRPSDAFCILAITMEDLYPEPSWNFVFGQAVIDGGVGVYSFARYDPLFYGQKRTSDYDKVLLKRSCKVLTHEMSHMFGLSHCIYYHCVMNGSNNLEESDARPLHLCPVCLRKLQYSIGFDVCDRYRRLYRFYQRIGFDEDSKWVQNRLSWILGVQEAQAYISRDIP